MIWHVNLLTLFPEMFPGPLGMALAGKALQDEIWSYRCVQMRDFSPKQHGHIDDTPYGGGAGMVIRPDVVERALLSVAQRGRLLYLSPRGRPLNQLYAEELASESCLTLLCGRYEGVDQRVLDAHDFEEVSIGDFVLSGGEIAAQCLMDACIRLLPGVMGNASTVDEESFAQNLLEYPHYTRPDTWEDNNGTPHSVPDVLKSGNHEKIRAWRHAKAEQLTKARRPDLWERYLSAKSR